MPRPRFPRLPGNIFRTPGAGLGGSFPSGRSIGSVQNWLSGYMASVTQEVVARMPALASAINMQGLSTFYGKGTGARAWKQAGRRAHKVAWDVVFDMQANDPRIKRAIANIVNKTMAAAVLYAKANHQGWLNRSGSAERSIRIIRRANSQNPFGEWGSDGSVHYFLFLELRYGTLRKTADVIYDPNKILRMLQAELVGSRFLKPTVKVIPGVAPA